MVVALTGPVAFVGIAKASVLVTSPLEFVETVFSCVGVGEGDTDGDGRDVGVGDGVGVTIALGVGVTEGVAEAVGEGEIEGVGPGLPPPPVPPPPVPPPPVPPPSVAAIMEKVLVIEVAAAYEPLPLCAATIEQEPVLEKVTTLLVIVQLPDAVKETANPEVLVAETVSGPGIVLFVMAAKVIVCSVFVIVKVLVPFAAS